MRSTMSLWESHESHPNFVGEYCAIPSTHHIGAFW